MSKMDLRELNESLKRELMSLQGVDREMVMGEGEARDRFLSGLEESLEVRCSCGLVMSRGSYYEHQKDTKHGVQLEVGKGPYLERESSAPPEAGAGQGFHVCSCGLSMSGANLREHQKETRHASQPREQKRAKASVIPSKLRRFEAFIDKTGTTFAGHDSLEEP